MTDYDELRRLAQAATEIPNGCCHADAETHHSHFLHSYMDGSAVKLPWGAFIAVANPSTILGLLDERDELRGRLARAASNGPIQNQVELVRDLSDARAHIAKLTADLAAATARADEALVSVDNWRQEVHIQKAENAALRERIAELEAENESLAASDEWAGPAYSNGEELGVPDNLLAERDRLADRIDKALALADWFDAQPNWREWGIGRQIRKALAADTPTTGDVSVSKGHSDTPTTATTLCVCGEGDFIGDSTPGPCYIDAAGFTVHRPTTATAEGSEG